MNTPNRQALPWVSTRYRLLRPLGQGGMGRVFEAEDLDEGRHVALKLLPPLENEDRRRFSREIRLVSTLRHEGVVRVFDGGESPEGPFFTMELLEGFPLDAFLAPGSSVRLEPAWISAVAVRVLEALEHVHARGWVHRDIKPANLFVVSREGRPRDMQALGEDPDPGVKILDFGLARNRRSEGPDTPISGTPGYMAPEQIRGEPCDARSDLWSLGATLYHAAVGKAPFASLGEALRSDRLPPLPRDANPRCPEALSSRIRELLDPLPSRRPSSAREARHRFLDILEPVLRARLEEPRLLPPTFVGREVEREVIAGRLRALARGEGSVLRIEGEAGAGKTWILEAGGFTRMSRIEHGVEVFAGQFRRGAHPHEGVRKAYRDLVDRLRSREPGPGDLSKPGPAIETFLATILDPEGKGTGLEASNGESRAAWQGAEPRLLREKLLSGAVELALACARIGPFGLVLEDVQHADEFALELLLRLARCTRDEPILLVLTHRAEVKGARSVPSPWLSALERDSEVHELVLGPPSDRDMEELLSARLRPDGSIGPRLLESVARSHPRTPLELGRVIDAFWHRGELILEAGIWSIREATRVEDPGTAARWKALDAEDLALVAACVLVGEPAGEALLARAVTRAGGRAPSRKGLRARLESLADRGFLSTRDGGYLAPPDASEDDLRGVVGAARWSAIHAGIAAGLLESSGTSTDAIAFRLAVHLDRAGKSEDAAPYYAAAARHAARTFANRNAREAYERAVAIAGAATHRRTLAVELGDVCSRLGDYDAALGAYATAGSCPLDRSGPSDLEILDRSGRVWQRKGNTERALELFARALEEAPPGSVERADGLFRIGGVHLDRGDPIAAAPYLEESLALNSGFSDPHRLAAVHSSLGLAHKLQGRLEAALLSFGESLREAERAGSLLDIATTLNNLGNLHRARGDDQSALDCLERSLKAREQAGDRQGKAVCANNMARILAFAGGYGAARESTLEAAAIFAEIGDRKGMLITRINLGEMALVRGDFRESRQCFEESIVEARALGIARLASTAILSLAEMELDRAEHAAAAARATECLESLGSGRFPDIRAQALSALAAARMAMGDLSGAGTAVEEADRTVPRADSREKAGILESRRLRWIARTKGPEAARLEARERLGDPLDLEGIERRGAAILKLELGCISRDIGPDWADLTEKYLGGAIREFDAMGAIPSAAAARREYARYWTLLGEDEEGLRWLRESQALVEGLDAPELRAGTGDRGDTGRTP